MPPETGGILQSLFILFRHKVQSNGLGGGFQLMVLDTGGIQHPLGNQIQHGILIFVGQVQHFLDAALDDGLGALVAGEQSHENPAAPEVTAVGIEDGIQLRVDHVGVLGILAAAVPGNSSS